MEITKALCLSTSHITADTAKWLDREPSTFGKPLPMTVWKGDYGWFLPCYDADARNQMATEGSAPEELLALLNRAGEADCEFLRLDADGSQMEGLPTYDW